MANDSTLNTPVLWINKYLQQKLGELVDIGIPIFPSSPSTIDDLTETFIKVRTTTGDFKNVPYGGVAGYWDRLVKMNRSGFPHIKCEQLLYYFYATEENAKEKMVKTQEAVLRLMDRGDETAEEINDWCKHRQVNLGTEQNKVLVDNMFYFHNFKVYQLEETRDIIDFGTARTYGGNKFIIDYDYHQMPELTENAWRPEFRPPGTQKSTI